MTNNTMIEKPESKIFSFLILIFLIGSALYAYYYHSVDRPAMFHEYEQRLRTEFHLPPNTELVKLKDTRSKNKKLAAPLTSNPDSYFIEAIFAFEEVDFDQYVKSLDDPQTWKPQTFSKTPMSNVYISDNANLWRNLPDAPFANIPFLFGSHFVRWDSIERPLDNANKYFCYALEPVGPEGQVLGTATNAKGSSCFISACADFPMSKTPLQERFVYPRGIVMGVLDYQTRRLHISISPQDANWACRPRETEDYSPVKDVVRLK